MPQPKQPHSGMSAQQRITIRRQQILATAYDVMKAGEWEKLSITLLCEQAALNKRYFYESFSDLNAVAVAIFEDLNQQLQQIALQAIIDAKQQQLQPNELALYILGHVIDYLSDETERMMILFTDQLTGLALVKHRLVIKDQLISLLVQYAKQHYQAYENTQDPMIQMTAALLIGGTVEILQQWLSGKILMSKQQLMLDLTALWQKSGDMTAQIVQQRENSH